MDARKAHAYALSIRIKANAAFADPKLKPEVAAEVAQAIVLIGIKNIEKADMAPLQKQFLVRQLRNQLVSLRKHAVEAMILEIKWRASIQS